MNRISRKALIVIGLSMFFGAAHAQSINVTNSSSTLSQLNATLSLQQAALSQQMSNTITMPTLSPATMLANTQSTAAQLQQQAIQQQAASQQVNQMQSQQQIVADVKTSVIATQQSATVNIAAAARKGAVGMTQYVVK